MGVLAQVHKKDDVIPQIASNELKQPASQLASYYRTHRSAFVHCSYPFLLNRDNLQPLSTNNNSHIYNIIAGSLCQEMYQGKKIFNTLTGKKAEYGQSESISLQRKTYIHRMPLTNLHVRCIQQSVYIKQIILLLLSLLPPVVHR